MREQGVTMVRFMGSILLLLFCLSQVPYETESKTWTAPKSCVPNGQCAMCDFTDESEDYCQETRRRQEYICRNDELDLAEDHHGEGPDVSMPLSGERQSGSHHMTNHHVLFHSCNSTPEDDVRAVVWFEVWMFAIGCLSLWGVHIQKSKNLTLYDQRQSDKNREGVKQSRSFRIQDVKEESNHDMESQTGLLSGGVGGGEKTGKQTLRRGRSATTPLPP